MENQYRHFFVYALSAVLALSAQVVVAQELCQSDFAFSSNAEESVAEAYLAIYGRPPDLQSLSSWSNQMSTGTVNLGDIIDTLATSDEYLERYGVLTNKELVAILYRQIFGREGAPNKEIAHFAAEIDSERMKPGDVALEMLATATAEDAAVVENRIKAAAYFVDCLTQHDRLSEAYNVNDSLLAPVVANINSVTDANTYLDALFVFDALIDRSGNQPPIAIKALIPPNTIKNAVHALDLPGYDPDDDFIFELADLGLLNSNCVEKTADQNVGWSHLCFDSSIGRLYLQLDGSGTPINIRYRVRHAFYSDENILVSRDPYAGEDDSNNNVTNPEDQNPGDQNPGEIVGTDINGSPVYNLTKEGTVFIPNQNHIGTSDNPRIEIYDGGQYEILYPGCAGKAPYGFNERRNCENTLEFAENIVYTQRLFLGSVPRGSVRFESGGVGSDHRVFDFSISEVPGDFNKDTVVCRALERGSVTFSTRPGAPCELDPNTIYFANAKVSGEGTPGFRGGPEDCGPNYRCRILVRTW